jgi:cytidine deaminase
MKKKPIEPRQRAELVKTAKEARRNSLCDLTHYAVGAAVLGGSGKVYGGCNIESPTGIGHICAERLAIYHALSQGERRVDAVCTVSRGSVPCGSCRQIIMEFGDGETPIFSLMVDGSKEKVVETTIADLLPQAHTAEMLGEIKGTK